MRNAQPVINFPVIGLSSPRNGRTYAFVARTELEMQECPLHSYLTGHLNGQYFIDSSGNRFKAQNVRIKGLDFFRMREVGLFTSVLTCIFSGLNFPILLSFDMQPDGEMDIGDLRNTLKKCVSENPKHYTWRVSERTVKARLTQARTYEELANAIST